MYSNIIINIRPKWKIQVERLETLQRRPRGVIHASRTEQRRRRRRRRTPAPTSITIIIIIIVTCTIIAICQVNKSS